MVADAACITAGCSISSDNNSHCQNYKVMVIVMKMAYNPEIQLHLKNMPSQKPRLHSTALVAVLVSVDNHHRPPINIGLDGALNIKWQVLEGSEILFVVMHGICGENGGATKKSEPSSTFELLVIDYINDFSL